MTSQKVGAEWSVEWVAQGPDDGPYYDWFILSREQAVEYGDELVQSLRVDGDILRKRGLDPDEPFAWKIEEGELLTKQISRKAFETVAESDRDDSYSARRTLNYRAERRINNSKADT